MTDRRVLSCLLRLMSRWSLSCNLVIKAVSQSRPQPRSVLPLTALLVCLFCFRTSLLTSTAPLPQPPPAQMFRFLQHHRAGSSLKHSRDQPLRGSAEEKAELPARCLLLLPVSTSLWHLNSRLGGEGGEFCPSDSQGHKKGTWTLLCSVLLLSS